MRKHSALFVLAGLALVLAAALQQGALGLSTDALSNGSNTFTTAACFGDTGFLNPSAQAADTGGDGNGFEVAPTNAYADGSGNASNINGAADRHRYYDYSISVQTATICGIAVQLDWWLDSTAGTNSMSVELSWDGGTSWTAAKTDATETTVEHTALLGGGSDTWGHAWTVSELSNAAFLVRVTSNSTSGSRDFFLDWVPVRVYWDPTAPTLTPTDTPTITPTPTNTPTPTDTPTPTATPTPLPNTGFVNCTADAAVTTNSGDNDGFEVTPGNACASGGGVAQDVNSGTNTNTTCSDTGKDRHRFYNYGFSLPSGSVINGIRVRLDASIDGGTSATRIMCVELSWDGGTSWTAAKQTNTLTTSQATYILGAASDTWGRSWATGDFSDANFRVRITDVAANNSRDFSLDWAAVEVTYTPP